MKQTTSDQHVVSRFNLVDEAWLPVAGQGRASLRDIFSRDDFSGLGGSPTEKIAVIKLLQAIAQRACTPEDDAAWQELGVQGMADKCLSYLQQRHDDFWLYGERPFLQFPAVRKAEIKALGALMVEVATGNTTVLFQTQAQPGEGSVDDASRALLLLVQMSCCLGGKKTDKRVILSPGVKKSSGKPGPALCSKGLLHSFFKGHSVRESVWLNLLTEKDVAQEKTFPGGIGVPPWEEMPEGEADARAEALKNCLMGRLVPLARFCLLTEDGIHYVEGLQHPDYLHGGVIDPSVAADFTHAKAKMIWADPARRPWRSLTALLSFLNHAENRTVICPQLKWGAARLRYSSLRSFSLWSGGVRLSSNAGEQYLSGDDDVVESEISLQTDWFDREGSAWFDSLQRTMAQVEQMGNTAYAAVSGYYRSANVDNAEDHAQKASQEFWHLAELIFPELSEACAGGQEEAQQAALVRMWGCVLQAYNDNCPQNTARQLQLWVQHSPRRAGKSRKK